MRSPSGSLKISSDPSGVDLPWTFENQTGSVLWTQPVSSKKRMRKIRKHRFPMPSIITAGDPGLHTPSTLWYNITASVFLMAFAKRESC